MGIIEDYLGNNSVATPAVDAPMPARSGLIEQYLDAPSGRPRVIIDTTPKPPISGFNKVQSDELNKRPETAGTPNNTQSFPSVGTATWDDAVAGLTEMGKGVQETLSNKPASGIGRVGMGALSTVGSLLSGPAKVIESVTGDKTFADKAELVAGGALPVMPLAKAASAIKPTNQALSMLVNHIGEKDLARVVKEMKADPTLSPADLSTRVRQSTQRLLANVDGPHANYIESAAEGRKAAAAGELQAHMATNLGEVVDPVKKLEDLKQNIRDVGSKEINPAIANSRPVDLTDTIAQIDDILKPNMSSKISNDTIIADPDLEKSLKSIRGYLTDDNSVRIDPEQLNRLQSAFRKKAEMMERKDPYTASAVMRVRDNIVTAIDKASDGRYKPALSKYRDEFQIQDAFEHGHDTIIKNGKSLSDRPEFFEKWVKDAKPEELQAAKEGALVAYDTQMNGFKHAARRGTDIGDVEFNRQRMETLFGKEDADKMAKVFNNAKQKADVNNKLTQGSQSRVQQAVGSEFEPYDAKKNKGGPLNTLVNVGLPMAAEGGAFFLGAPTGLGGAIGAGALIGAKLAAKAGSSAKSAVIKKLENERNMEYAKYALPTDGPSRDELIKKLDAIANKPVKLSMSNKLRTLIAP